MSKAQKLLDRFLSRPADFAWNEMVALLGDFGFKEVSSKGGSYRTFIDANSRKIFLHKPHPQPIVKRYALDDVRESLESFGMIRAKDDKNE